MLARVLILLPPSEGKYSPRRGKALDLGALGFNELTAARETVLSALIEHCAADPGAAATALGLGPTQTAHLSANTLLRTAPTARADRIYTGVLYDALGLSTLKGPARSRATRWLAIMSSTFGVVRPSDPIPAYRLSGDTKLPGIGIVSSFWKDHLDAVLPPAAGAGLVIDLRSGTYAGFWRPATGADVATVRVLHEHNGTRKVVSHFNKATKGRIVRDLLEDGSKPRSPGALAEHLTGLGWTVELHEPGKHGQQLDVIVSEL
jgi:cytoplasmic iron level regulating protein YaaA (DUF328/UPF0246 family)